jgi:Zn-dependent M28 family amino/carboxypeptidase
MVTQPFISKIPSSPPSVDIKNLQVHVKKLSVDFHPRSFSKAKNTALTVDYIIHEFKTAGADVSIQTFQVEESSYKNIIARFGSASKPLLVIGAHYDAEENTPGADDNASGVAGLIELARLLAKQKQNRAIELVAYALEEPPYFRSKSMGSAIHAMNLAKQNRSVQLMISMEMIGYFSDEPGSQDYPMPIMSAMYPDKGNFIAVVGKLSDFMMMRRIKAIMSGATDLEVFSMNAPTFIQGIDFSDHLNYWHEGYPALMVTDTAFNRNKNYHEAGDTYQKLDYQCMAKVVQSIYAVTQLF